MDYDDPTQNLHIHLKAGEQLLDGDKAEQLVRFRHNNNWTTYPDEYGDNDAGRMRTQREFIMQVIKQTAKPENIFKLGQILDVAKENVETNIDFKAAKDYIPYIVEFNTDNLLNATLPGVNSDNNTSKVWVFVYNKAETEKLVQELFYNRDLEIPEETSTEGSENTSNTAGNTTSNNISKKGVKIEILNGSGENKKLQKVVNQLEGAGYNITRTGVTNATSKTTIINKKTVNNILLKNMKDVIGVGDIADSESSSSKVDVTIIIGKDYQ